MVSIDSDRNAPWTVLLRHLCEAPGLALPEERWNELRYLDIDGEQWCRTPTRLSDVHASRLAVIYPDSPDYYHESARLASELLCHSLDRGPAELAARATLHRDLEAIAREQRTYYSSDSRYAASLEELSFIPAPGNDIDLIAGESGWAAVATRAEYPLHLGFRCGDGVGNFNDQQENSVFVVNFTPTELFVLHPRNQTSQDVSI